MEQFRKTKEEKELVKEAKDNYKAGMKAYFGKDWKTKSRIAGFNNVPNLKM